MTPKDPVHQLRCDVEATLPVVGGKWRLLPIWFLRDAPRRFGECRRQFPEISQKVLTRQLRGLEADGVVQREVFRDVPPRVEHSLTPFGQGLAPVLAGLDEGGHRNGRRLLAPRRRSDLVHGSAVPAAPRPAGAP